MNRLLMVPALLLVVTVSRAQFVWPKPEYRNPEPGVYQEDPFVVEYRRKFFAVFRGDYPTFEKAYEEIEVMVRKKPRDPRALVWRGNGKTVKAALLLMRGEKKVALALLGESRKDLDAAVALKPDDPNIFMMRAATLYVQGQYFPKDELPKAVWERLRDDCEHLIRFLGPERIKKVSIHVRGEAYGELGVAYRNLGEKEKAREAFEKLIEVCPGTEYETKAKKQIASL